MTARTITLTPAEAEKFTALAVGESMWIVRDGIVYPVLRPSVSPPAVFVQACAPCETCGGSRCAVPPDCDCDVVASLNFALCTHPPAGCPDCRIELVDAKPCCGADDGCCFRGDCSRRDGVVTLGYAYAVGQPLPIVQVPFLNVRQTPYDFAHGHTGPLIEVTQNGRVLLWTHPDGGFHDITAALAHYGPPETLVGRWALQLAVTQ